MKLIDAIPLTFKPNSTKADITFWLSKIADMMVTAGWHFINSSNATNANLRNWLINNDSRLYPEYKKILKTQFQCLLKHPTKDLYCNIDFGYQIPTIEFGSEGIVKGDDVDIDIGGSKDIGNIELNITNNSLIIKNYIEVHLS